MTKAYLGAMFRLVVFSLFNHADPYFLA